MLYTDPFSGLQIIAFHFAVSVSVCGRAAVCVLFTRRVNLGAVHSPSGVCGAWLESGVRFRCRFIRWNGKARKVSFGTDKFRIQYRISMFVIFSINFTLLSL